VQTYQQLLDFFDVPKGQDAPKGWIWDEGWWNNEPSNPTLGKANLTPCYFGLDSFSHRDCFQDMR
jgi:uncharacterized membrane protein